MRDPAITVTVARLPALGVTSSARCNVIPLLTDAIAYRRAYYLSLAVPLISLPLVLDHSSGSLFELIQSLCGYMQADYSSQSTIPLSFVSSSAHIYNSRTDYHSCNTPHMQTNRMIEMLPQ